MRILFILSIFLLHLNLCSQNQDWITKFEACNDLETVSYEECINFSKRLAKESPMIHYQDMGFSPQNRAIPLLIIDKEGLTNPMEIKNTGRLVLLIQAGMHAGEPGGTDAGFLLLRDMIVYEKHLDLLDHVSILFIPSFNVAGLARQSPYNRINQKGANEMGWRSKSLNLKPNRGYMKAESPEMMAWLKVFNDYLPDFFIDCHTTDGADYQYVATYALETFGNMDQDVTKFALVIYEP